MDVKKVHEKDNAVVVEFVKDAKVQRAIIPASALKEDGTALVEDLEAGAPYGLPFAEIFEPQVTAERLEECLHNNGIWTMDDMQSKPALVVAALQAAYRMDFSTLLVAASAYKPVREQKAPARKYRKEVGNE
jgi:hypothetical protein